MSLEKFIKESINIIGNNNRIYISPNIEAEKLQNTINTICKGIDPDEILAIYDSTVFGSSKEGIVFTKDSLFYRGSLVKAVEVKYKDLKHASYLKQKVENKDRKFEFEELVTLDIEGEEKVVIIKNLLKINFLLLTDFINNVKREFSKELENI